MQAEEFILDGVPLLKPVGLIIPYTKIEDFPDCCGAGNGIGTILVPDTMYGLRVSPACYIHDYDFDKMPPTWEAFHIANSRFLHNLISIIQYTSDSNILRHVRLYRCVSYYNAVDSIGVRIFWGIKNRQQVVFGMWPEYSPVIDILNNLNRRGSYGLGCC